MATNQGSGPAENRGTQHIRLQPTLVRAAIFVVLLAATALAIGDSNSARADTCWSLAMEALPAEGGSFQVIDGFQGACPPGQYLHGGVYHVEATANPGWRLAKITGGAAVPGFPDRVIGLFLGNVTVQATFARELTHAVPGPTDTIQRNELRFYAIDVPNGVTGLSIAMTGTNDADLSTRFGEIAGPRTCVSATSGSNETCNHLTPAAGTWYAEVRGVGADAAAVTITATIDACWEVSLSSNPPGMMPNISPAQNCPGGYQHGTSITVTPVASADSPFTGWYGSASGIDNPLQYTVTEGASIMALHAVEVTEGSPLADQYVPVGADRYFYLDATASMNTVRFKAELSDGTGAVGLYGYPEVDNGDKICAGGIDNQSPSGVCEIPLPPEVRIWFIVSGVGDTLVDISVSHCVPVTLQVHPEGSGTIAQEPPFECPGGYSSADSFTADPNPAAGHVFVGWTPNNLTGDYAHVFPLAGTAIQMTAEFAKTLTSGVAESIPEVMPQGRFYAFYVGPSADRVEILRSGPVTAELLFHNPFGEGCVLPASSQCFEEDPNAGSWWVWVERTGAGDATITVNITPVPTACYEIVPIADPPGSGTFLLDPPSDPDCAAGKYKVGTELTIEAVPNPGYAFWYWNGSGGTYIPELTMTVEFPNAVYAYFGLPLTSGDPLTVQPLPNSGGMYFYIDVPPGTASITPTVSIVPAEVGFFGYFEEAANPDDSCYFGTSTEAETCAKNNPGPGRWWLAAFPYWSNDFTGLTVTLTFGDELICRAFSIEAVPPEAPSRPFAVSPSPNCDGGTYLHGTEVTYDIPSGNPGYVPAVVEFGAGSFELAANVNYSVPVLMDTAVKVHYATRTVPGTLEDLVLPPYDSVAFFVDLPPGVSAFNVAATGMAGVNLFVGGSSGTSYYTCTSQGAAETKGCDISYPVITRWFIVLQGDQQGFIELAITVTPSIAGTIDTTSPSYIFLGANEPVQLLVHGFDFDPGELIWFNGVALDTQFVSANLLTATIPAGSFGTEPRNYVIFVSATEPPNLTGGDTLPTNSVNLLLTRPSSDVNCDGEETAADALDLLRYLAGFEVPGFCLGDVNLDKSTTIADAARLRAEIAGLAGRLPMPLIP